MYRTGDFIMSTDDTPDLSRRRLLTRLGLAAGVAYVAPTMLHLTPAKASGNSRPSYSRPSRSHRSFSRPSHARRDRYRDDRRYYERGGYRGPYRDQLTREERAVQYLLETLTTR
jgi:hypothetical protein